MSLAHFVRVLSSTKSKAGSAFRLSLVKSCAGIVAVVVVAVVVVVAGVVAVFVMSVASVVEIDAVVVCVILGMGRGCLLFLQLLVLELEANCYNDIHKDAMLLFNQ